jgi:hypothetical protein
MYVMVTNFDFYLLSFDANISYDDVLQSVQAAELQYGSPSQAGGVKNKNLAVKVGKKHTNDFIEYKNVKPVKSIDTNKTLLKDFKTEVNKYERSLCNFCGHLKSNKHTDTSDGDKEATCILQNHPECNKTASLWATSDAKKIWAASPYSIKGKVAYSCLSDGSPWDSPDVVPKTKYLGFKKSES